MTGGPTGRRTSGPVGRPADRPTDSARIDEVFGQTVPETTSDEARDREGRIDDDWWHDQRPPHHG